MSKSIRVSPKHGLNPSIPLCFYCGKEKNEIVIPGMLKGDAEAPHKAVWDRIPCETCKGYMKAGVILISVADGEDGSDNPYRTGRFVVVRDRWVKQLAEPTRSDILKKRVAFVEDSVWKAIGLPDKSK